MIELLIFLSSDTLELTLSSAIDIGLTHNLSYLENKIELEEKGIYFTEALTQYIPSPYYSWQKNDADPEKLHISSLNIEQPILDVTKITSLVSSFYSFKSNKCMETEKRNALVLLITQKYVELLKAKFKLKIVEKSLKRAEFYKKLVEKKLKIGKGTLLEKQRASLELTKARIEFIEQKNQVKIKEREFLETIGIEENVAVKLHEFDVPDEYQIPPYDSIQKVFLKCNPVIKNQKILLSSSKKKLFLSALSILPTITYKWSYTYVGKEAVYSPGDIINRGNYSKGLIFSIVLNPFSYWLSSAKLEKEVERLNLQLKEKIVSLSRELENLYLSLSTVHEKIKLSKQARKEAEISLRIAKKQFQLGTITLMELMDAEKNFRNAEYQLFSSLYDAFILKENINYIAGMEVIK